MRQFSRKTEFQNVDISSWHEVHCGRPTIACSVNASPSTCAWFSGRRSCKRHRCARIPLRGIRARKIFFVYHADQVSVVFMSRNVFLTYALVNIYCPAKIESISSNRLRGNACERKVLRNPLLRQLHHLACSSGPILVGRDLYDRSVKFQRSNFPRGR
jgi:hypothetical protein